MADYKLYCLNRRDKIITSHWIEAETDEDAVNQARAMELPHDCELWLGSRKVCRLPHLVDAQDRAPLTLAAAASPQDLPQSGIRED